jgi:rare lipoprotein A
MRLIADLILVHCVMARSLVVALAGSMLLVGCASASKPVPRTASNGSAAEAPAKRPPNLDRTPDAEPRVMPLRVNGGNAPYTLGGKRYVPQTNDEPFKQRGMASWYGPGFHGKRTASGETYDMYAMTAAHPTLPLPSFARVRNPANGREIIVRINDRGPFHGGRIIDLSYTAALKLHLLRGVAPVEVERITNEQIRAGTWKRGNTAQSPREADKDTAVDTPDTAPPATLTVTPVPPVSDAPPAPEAASQPSAPPAASEPPSPSSPGSAPSAPSSVPTVSSVAAGFWVQLAAFQDPVGASSFAQRVAAELAWLAPLLAILSDRSLHRLQAGPYPTREDAQGVAQRVRDALQLVPTIVERC